MNVPSLQRWSIWIVLAVLVVGGGVESASAAEADDVAPVATYKFDTTQGWRPHPTWLTNPAAEGEFAIELSDGRVKLTVKPAGTGMKWSKVLEHPLNLSGVKWGTLLYRACRTAPHHDYVVWAGSAPGGMPPDSQHLVRLGEITPDDAFRTVLFPVKANWRVKELAIQCQAGSPDACIILDSIRFFKEKPVLSLKDEIYYETGHDRAELPADNSRCVDLASCAKCDGRRVVSSIGLRGWFETSEIVISGIPFKIAMDGKNAVETGMDKVGSVEVPVGCDGRELFLLLMLDHPRTVPRGPWKRPGPMGPIDDVERFLVELEYDGVAAGAARRDRAFPMSYPGGMHIIRRGVGLYTVLLRPGQKLRAVRLVDKMRRGNFVLAGLTVNRSDRTLGKCAELPPPHYELAHVKPLAASPPDIKINDDSAAVSNGVLTVTFGLKPKLCIRSMRSRYFGEADLNREASPLFAVRLGKATVTSEEFRLDAVNRSENGITIACSGTGKFGRPDTGGRILGVSKLPDGAPIPLKAKFSAAFETSGELVFRLELRHEHAEPVRMTVLFPVFRHLVLGSVADTWYLYMHQGGIIHNAPIHKRDPHSGRHPTQVTDLFSPSAGAGLYFMSRDKTNTRPTYDFEKNAGGATYQLAWTEQEIRRGETYDLSPVAVAAHAGDWRVAVDAYKSWLRTWYRPAAPRKPWFRSAFAFRQMNIQGMYDKESDTYHFRDAVAREEEMFGPVDWVHIISTLIWARPGEYTTAKTPEQIAKLRDAFADLKRKVPVSIYTEGYLLDERTDIARQHLSEWQLIRPNGKRHPYARADAKQIVICSSAVGWQDFLSGVYRKIVRDIAPSATYIDQYGFCNYTCYSDKHGHRVPEPANRGERELTRKVREAVGPDVAVWTEETPPDCNSMMQDGSFSHFSRAQDHALAPHHSSLFRYCFPGFACVEIVYNEPLEDGRWSLLKFPFFNGLGYWLNGPAGQFEPECRAFIKKVCGIMRQHKDAFASERFTPLVPTLVPGVYCNRFDGKAETVWTFYNARYETVRGPVIEVQPGDGRTFADAWNGRHLKPRRSGGKSVLEFEIDPRGLMCIVGAR